MIFQTVHVELIFVFLHPAAQKVLWLLSASAAELVFLLAFGSASTNG
jgi:hypothetical protein